MFARCRIVGCLAFLGAAAFGATQPASEWPKLVRFHVAAFDSSGKPVEDLTADDFRIQDQKKDRRIVLFHRNTPHVGNEFSNRVATPVRPPTVILLDMLNQGRQAQIDSIKDLQKTLAATKSGDSLFLYMLTVEGVLEPMHPVEDWSKTDWIKQIGPVLEKASERAGLPKPAGQTVEATTKQTYVALETLSSKLAEFPGPRKIVWLTYGVPNVKPSQAATDGSRPQTDYRAPVGGVGGKSGLYDDAKGVPWVAGAGEDKCPGGIWVDCGLYVPHLSLTLDHNNTSVYLVNYAGTPLSPDWVRGNEQFVGLTGGRNMMKPNLEEALAQSASDAQGGYTIAFEEPKEGLDNKFHVVKLACSRKDVNLLARERYFAAGDKRDAAAREQGALANAFNIPSNVADIGLRVSVTPNADQKSARLLIRVDPDDVVLERKGDAYDGQLTVSWLAYNDNGPFGNPGMMRLPVHLESAQLATAKKDGILITQDVAVDNTVRFVRLFVVDRTTEMVGSLMIPLSR